MTISCTHCFAPFEVTDEDRAFFEKVAPTIGGIRQDIPPPTHCPLCRYQRRLAFRNERTLYHRKCDLTGKSMISMHPADTPFPVYHISEWLTDQWDPKTYGREVDFTRPFLVQFAELCNAVPHFSAFIDPRMDVNAEYTNCSSQAKNCYLITQAEMNEDCYYSRGINTCKSCSDCLRVHRCELCYECTSTRTCYRCLFCSDCDNCSDCLFSSDLRGCKKCFGCHGLVQKEYHIFNEPVSPEEWEATIASQRLSHTFIAESKRKSEEVRLRTPQRATRIVQCETSTGDDLLRCKNCRNCFDCNDIEDCAYCNEVPNSAKDCMDFSMFGLNSELVYECGGGGYGMYHTLFSHHCWNNVSHLLYCESCFPSVHHCFGCFGLKQSQYCILNTQYTEEAYEALTGKIIDHMRSTGEWGEFFPPSISAYGYNETVAQDFFPLTKEEVLRHGWMWRDEATASESYLGPDIVAPETIEEVQDDITEKIVRCEITHKPYRITRQELDLYRTLGVPLPRKAPQTRHAERVASRRPRRLWTRTCAKCEQPIETTYSPDRPEIVYCESCYLSTVY